jgi:hypothetical protein
MSQSINRRIVPYHRLAASCLQALVTERPSVLPPVKQGAVIVKPSYDYQCFLQNCSETRRIARAFWLTSASIHDTIVRTDETIAQAP